MSLEHTRERLIGSMVRFKKLIKNDYDSFTKKIDEHIVQIDKARDELELGLVLTEILIDMAQMKQDRSRAFEEWRKKFD